MPTATSELTAAPVAADEQDLEAATLTLPGDIPASEEDLDLPPDLLPEIYGRKGFCPANDY